MQNGDNQIRQRRKSILECLILKQAIEWTLGTVDPSIDLEEIGILRDEAEKVLRDLVQDKLLRPSICFFDTTDYGRLSRARIVTIIDNPKIFREKIILTKKGEARIEQCNLSDLFYEWMTFDDDESTYS